MLESFDSVEVGTRLKIRDDLRHSRNYKYVHVAPEMAQLRGQIVVVTFKHVQSELIHVGSNSNLESTYGTSNWFWWWSPSMFECIVDKPAIKLFDILAEGAL